MMIQTVYTVWISLFVREETGVDGDDKRKKEK